ncbi:unnamed protein product, partial [Onchocerca ochengi]|uniref:ATP-dependent helicase Rep n=1 Tax=Onchocerca ochengi TaxID=42157 RepID=A0A182ETG9_ONCOC
MANVNAVSTTTTTTAANNAFENNSRGKCWIATIFDVNNFTMELVERIGMGLKYGIVGRETCPQTNRLHFQCYFYFNTSVRFGTLRGRLPTGTYIQLARGTAYQNFLYCSKEHIEYEIGQRPEPQQQYLERKRKTQQQSMNLKKFLNNHLTLDELVEEDNLFVMRNVGKMMTLKTLLLKDRTEKTDLYLIIGDAGVGKTKFACSLSKSYFIKTVNTEKWWDGYEQQEVVILDDFYGWLTPNELFNLADSTKHMVQVKGGLMKFNSKALVITSNKLPEFWWKPEVVEKYDMDAFDRRVTITWIWKRDTQTMMFNYKFNMEM